MRLLQRAWGWAGPLTFPSRNPSERPQDAGREASKRTWPLNSSHLAALRVLLRPDAALYDDARAISRRLRARADAERPGVH